MSNHVEEKLPGLYGYSESLRELTVCLTGQCEAIEKWFALEWEASPAPFYGSVDLRNAGYKIAPVDMNLFPAGFNNLNPQFLDVAVTAAGEALRKAVPQAKTVLLVPESHTRNLFYWENIRVLCSILSKAGFTVTVGSLLPDEIRPASIALSQGDILPIAGMVRVGDRLEAGGKTPDVIVLNNDLSEGVPELLQGLAQPVLPSPSLGWSHRLKSEHFRHYAEVCDSFARLTGIDPWQIAPLFRYCGEVDFMRREGLACLLDNATVLFDSIGESYAGRHIKTAPFVVVKADAGTYGMGVMTIRSVEELKTLNRKQRTSMAKTKSGQPVRRVILQEGVYSHETVGPEQAVAEPVVYLFGEKVIGGFYRVHKGRGTDESLNAPGMHFEPLPFIRPCHMAVKSAEAGECECRYYLYGLIARLSMLAAAREWRELQA